VVLIDLAHNVGLLVSLVVLYRILTRRWPQTDPRVQVLSGVLFGAVGLLGMVTPIRFAEGIIFDARSVVLAVAGLFGGPLVAAIAAAVCAAYRYSLGGDGVWVGIAVILEAAALGVAFHYVRRREPRVTDPLPLLGVGVLVHAVMLALMLLLPHGAGLEALRRMGSAILIAYPLATVLVGRVVVDGEERLAAVRSLLRSEERYRELADGIPAFVCESLADGTVTYANQALVERAGGDETQVVGARLADLCSPAEALDVRRRIEALTPASPTETHEQVGRDEAGSDAWVEWTNRAFFDTAGRLERVQALGLDITERKHAEAALREAQERYSALVQASMDGFWVLDREGRIVEVNDAYCTMSGYAREALLSMHVADIEMCESHADARAHAARIAEGGWDRFESKHRRADGSAMEVQVSALHLASRQQTMAFMSDITERKRTEEALRASEASYRLLIEHTSDLIWTLDADGVFTYASPSWERVTGYAPSDIVGGRFHPLVHPDDLSMCVDYLRGMVESRVASSGPEYRVKHADGEWHWHAAASAPVLDAQGQFVSMVGVSRDVTERTRAQQELAQEHLLMETLLEGLPGIFYLYTYPELRLVRWNRNHETLLGYTGEEIRDRSIMEWHVPEAMDAVREAIDLVMEQGQNTIESPLLAKDGRSVPFLMTGVRLDVPGQSYLMGVGIDITERKRIEEERSRLEVQLQQTQRLESLGVLAGGIAHDFNNILAGIQGFTEIALDHVGPQCAAAAYLQHALAGTTRATELVRQILAFSRQAPMDQAAVSLHTLAKDVLRFARATLPATVEIRQDLDPDVPPVEADPTQIHQVVLNLCTNAEYAMRPDGGVLTVTLEATEVGSEQAQAMGLVGPGRYALLTVSDTGCGMDAATVDRLFEPFFTTKPTGEGTGLGLATSHGIVTRHGGAITAESELGVGTAFRVYLPALTGGREQAAQPVEGELPKGAGRVLLVDDEPSVLAAEESRLRSLGYTPTASVSSTEALALFRSDPSAFDLVLSDQTMPGMTGLDLASEVRTISQTIPFVLATGFSTVVTPETVQELGISEVLLKPYTRRKLAEAMRRALGAHAPLG
jgi:PAS domain S-box-containing protein